MSSYSNDDAYYCSTQTVFSWVELYEACQYSSVELMTRLTELIDGTYVPQWTCEIPLRIGALQQILGIAEAPTGWVCPTCMARERKKSKSIDTAQTSLFA